MLTGLPEASNVSCGFTAEKEKPVYVAAHRLSGNVWRAGAAFSVPGASPGREGKGEDRRIPEKVVPIQENLLHKKKARSKMRPGYILVWALGEGLWIDWKF
jgi:hypothetical protein